MSKDTVLYRFYGASGDLLYVGITSRIESRLSQHRRSKPWVDVAMITLEHHVDRTAASAAESRAIRSERPAWNVMRPPMARAPVTRDDDGRQQRLAWAMFDEIFSDMCHNCEQFGTDEAYMIHMKAGTARVDYVCKNCGHRWYCSWGAFDAWLYPETIRDLYAAFPPRTAWIHHHGVVRQLVFTEQMKKAMQPVTRDD